jgi:hypothetical protein
VEAVTAVVSAVSIALGGHGICCVCRCLCGISARSRCGGDIQRPKVRRHLETPGLDDGADFPHGTRRSESCAVRMTGET